MPMSRSRVAVRAILPLVMAAEDPEASESESVSTGPDLVARAMKLKTRTVETAGITSQPHNEWMTQVARNLTDADDGFLRGVQCVILD